MIATCQLRGECTPLPKILAFLVDDLAVILLAARLVGGVGLRLSSDGALPVSRVWTAALSR